MAGLRPRPAGTSPAQSTSAGLRAVFITTIVAATSRSTKPSNRPFPQPANLICGMAKQNYYGLILAGGRGTRFWLRSRKRTAKQVLNIGGGDSSLIQETVARLSPLIPPERILILTNEFVRDEIVRQLPQVPAKQIIAEPAQRNTAPAIGLAAHILASADPNAIFGVFPSDHVISNPKRYLSLVRAAFRA